LYALSLFQVREKKKVGSCVHNTRHDQHMPAESKHWTN